MKEEEDEKAANLSHLQASWERSQLPGGLILGEVVVGGGGGGGRGGGGKHKRNSRYHLATWR